MDANGSTMTRGILSSPTMTTAGESPAARRLRLKVRRTGIVLKPNNSRVVIRPFEPASDQRIERIIARIMSLSEAEVDVLLDDVMREFHSRHQKTRDFFLHRFDQLKKYLLDQPVAHRESPDADRRVFHPGIRAGIGRALQSVDGLASRPVRTGRGSTPVRAQPARHRRGTYLVDHLPQRHARRPEPHPHGRADALRDRARTSAQHALRQDLVFPQAARAGRRQLVYRQGPGHAQRPVHTRRAQAGRQPGPCTRAGRATPRTSRSCRGCSPWPRPITRSAIPPSNIFPSESSSRSHPPSPTGSRTPASSSSTTTTARSVTTPPTPPSTAR